MLLRSDIPIKLKKLHAKLKENVSTEKQQSNDWRFIDKHGNWHWFQCLSNAYFGPDGQMRINVVSFDITDKKQIKDELANTKAMLETAFLQSPVPMVLVSSPDYVLRIVNKACRKILGVIDEPEKTGKSLFEFKQSWQDFNEEGIPKNINEMPLAMALKGIETKNAEYFLKRKDGTIRWYIASASPIKNDSSEIIAAYVIFVDITERKQAEKSLQNSEARLNNALMIARLGPWEYDTEKDLFTFNDAFYSIFRTTAEKNGGYIMSSKDYSKRFVHPEDAFMVGMEINKAMETDDPDFSSQIEHRMIYANGSSGYISVRFFIVKDEFGKTIKTYGVNQDITDRKKTEMALMENVSRYRSLFENSSDSIFLIDRETLQIIDANPAACRTYGYNLDEFRNMKNTDVSAEPDKTSQSVKEGVLSVFLRYHRKKNGTVFPVEISGGYFELNGRLYHTAFIRDITERIKSEQEIKILMEKQELLLKEVHHRIKNDMNVISGLISIQANSNKYPEVKYSLQELKARINVMFNIYNQLYKKIDFQSISLKEFIFDLVNNIKLLYDEMNPIEFEMDIDEMELDRNLSFPLGIIINELITNSYKYAYIDSGNKDNKKIKIISKKPAAEILSIIISDNGNGFPEDILANRSYGFGLKLISILSAQIKCGVRFINNKGASVELSIPMSV